MKKFDIFHEPDRAVQKLVKPGEANFGFLENDVSHNKCLPLRIAGNMGWDIVMPETWTVNWNGGNSRKDIAITKPNNPELFDFVTSSLGNGIVTIKIPYLFNLEKGNFLWLKGANNNPLALGLYPMEGLVESDWFSAHITMNYKIIEKNKDILLAKDTPYCRAIPYPKKYIEDFQPTYREITQNSFFLKKLFSYIRVDKLNPFSKMHLKSYAKGFDGIGFVENIKRVSLTSPISGDIKKCPFHKLFNL